MSDIKRYGVPLIGKAKPDAAGEFVSYADHQAAIDHLRRQVEAMDAKVPPRGEPTSRPKRRLSRAARKRRAAGVGAIMRKGGALWS